uniref:Small ribosomal subunit protein mS29 n=1 Tax=Rhipicephalus microplus TaxID=6941 RepID=A0A6M2CJL9_RHIMP
MVLKIGRLLLRSKQGRHARFCAKCFATQVAVAPEKSLPHFRTSESDPTNHTVDHEAKFYTVPEHVHKSLFEVYKVPKKFQTLNEMFGEMSIMVRQPYLEVKSYIESYDYSLPALRIMLYGQMGCGKAITQAHLLHYALANNWIVVPKEWAAHWVKRPKDHAQNANDETLIDSPIDAAVWLQQFRVLNATRLKELNLTTTQTYNWSEREATQKGEPLTNIVEHGVERMKHACSCMGALLQEIKMHTDSGRMKTMVIVKGVNSFWQDTYIRRLDRSYIPAKDLIIVRAFKEILKNDWRNAAIVVSVDQAALSLKHLGFTHENVPCYYPKYLLGLEGFEFFEPFIPVHVPKYSEKEIDSCLDYYLDRGYIQNPNGWTDEGKAELKFLSGYNPRELCKVCRWR